jgi:hypothetical protein
MEHGWKTKRWKTEECREMKDGNARMKDGYTG